MFEQYPLERYFEARTTRARFIVTAERGQYEVGDMLMEPRREREAEPRTFRVIAVSGKGDTDDVTIAELGRVYPQTVTLLFRPLTEGVLPFGVASKHTSSTSMEPLPTDRIEPRPPRGLELDVSRFPDLTVTTEAIQTELQAADDADLGDLAAELLGMLAQATSGKLRLGLLLAAKLIRALL